MCRKVGKVAQNHEIEIKDQNKENSWALKILVYSFLLSKKTHQKMLKKSASVFVDVKLSK